MPDREHFSEAEVHAILKRAAERQHRADLSAEARATGLSKRELEHVAAAAGIDAQHVHAATLEVERRSDVPARPSQLTRIAGGPTRIHLERTASGRLDEALWQKIVVELRRTFNTPGIPDQLGAIREWRSNGNAQDQAEVQAEEVDGVVHLTLRRSWVSKAAGPIGSAAFATAFSLFLLLIGVFSDKVAKVMPLVGAFMVLSALVVVGTRVFYPRWTRNQTERFAGLMDRLEGIVEGHNMVEAHNVPPATQDETGAAQSESVSSVLSLDEVAGNDEPNLQARHPARSRTRT